MPSRSSSLPTTSYPWRRRAGSPATGPQLRCCRSKTSRRIRSRRILPTRWLRKLPPPCHALAISLSSPAIPHSPIRAVRLMCGKWAANSTCAMWWKAACGASANGSALRRSSLKPIPPAISGPARRRAPRPTCSTCRTVLRKWWRVRFIHRCARPRSSGRG